MKILIVSILVPVAITCQANAEDSFLKFNNRVLTHCKQGKASHVSVARCFPRAFAGMKILDKFYEIYPASVHVVAHRCSSRNDEMFAATSCVIDAISRAEILQKMVHVNSDIDDPVYQELLNKEHRDTIYRIYTTSMDGFNERELKRTPFEPY